MRRNVGVESLVGQFWHSWHRQRHWKRPERCEIRDDDEGSESLVCSCNGESSINSSNNFFWRRTQAGVGNNPSNVSGVSVLEFLCYLLVSPVVVKIENGP